MPTLRPARRVALILALAAACRDGGEAAHPAAPSSTARVDPRGGTPREATFDVTCP